MAGEWIKLQASTPDKPEVLKIARKLGVDRDAVLGKLVRLWCWMDVNSVDGGVDGVVGEDVDDLCRCAGFAAAVVAVGWLEIDVERERVSLPNFDAHNGETAKNRAGKARRQARWRAGAGQETSTPVDGAASTGATTREEKRRNTTPISPDAAEKPKRAPRKGTKRTLAEWIASLDGKPALTREDAIFAYAEKTQLPGPFIRLAWLEFRRRFIESPKQQINWRQTFRNYVEANYLKLWYADADGYALTSTGVQAERFHREEQADA